MILLQLIDQFTSETINVLDYDMLIVNAVAAVKYYAGYKSIDARIPLTEITEQIDISESEWVIIKPLFRLYVERATAMQLEASRVMGVDVFGRSVAEVTQEITQYEGQIAYLSFNRDILTV